MLIFDFNRKLLNHCTMKSIALILVIMFLTTPYILPVPLIAYEFFVGFIQAFIFAILTLYFVKLAIEAPHDEH